jgi:hypothetical protein
MINLWQITILGKIIKKIPLESLPQCIFNECSDKEALVSTFVANVFKQMADP